MFNGNSSVSFKSSKTKLDVIKIVEEELETLGTVNITSSGGITITGSRFNGFSYKYNIDGRVNERDGRFTINIDYQAKPDVIGWLIGICFFPIGLAIFILANNAKGDIQRKADNTLSEIKSILEEK
jgi:hypothetical protein